MLIDKKRNNEGRLDKREEQTYGDDGQAIIRQWSALRVSRGCLYKLTDGKMLAVLPPELRKTLFDHLHNNPHGGAHVGAMAVRKATMERAWWPRMCTEVQEWIEDAWPARW
jgi:hypothetical protein